MVGARVPVHRDTGIGLGIAYDEREDHVEVKPGDLVVGRYEVEGPLGGGGMGYVVAAKQLDLGRRVALKFLRDDVVDRDDDARARFEREARAAVRLKGEHIARVLDVGRLDSGAPFIVMELVEGEGLDRLLARTGPLDVPLAVDLVLQACEGLAEAHANGVLHRDIKPSNLMLTKRVDGSPLLKVVDFGLAKIAPGAETGPEITTSAGAFGSPSYMAPEQMKAPRGVDARADQWSLGVTLYELLSGQRPFRGETAPEVFAAVLGATAKPISSLRSSLALELASAVHRCLEKDPARRFADVAALAHAIERFGSPASTGAAARIRRILGTPEPLLHEASERRSRRARVGVLVAATLATLCGGAFAIAHSRGESPKTDVDTRTRASSTEADAAADAAEALRSEEPAKAAAASTSTSTSTPTPIESIPSASASVTRGRPAAPVKRPPSPADCRNPFRIGPDGTKIAKRECL